MPSDISWGVRWTPQQERAAVWIQETLRRFRYKPGWQFGMCRREGGPVVRAEFMAENSRHPSPYPRYKEPRMVAEGPLLIERDDLIPISGEFPAPPPITDAEDDVKFFDWLHEVVGFMEDHERDEWFRVDGILRCDPHAPIVRSFDD
jgi:hypothetical protein